MVKFLKRHPMLPLIIPAALLIYFVYVALGWNLWVSGSDWEQYSLEASYGFGGFQWYNKGKTYVLENLSLSVKEGRVLRLPRAVRLRHRHRRPAHQRFERRPARADRHVRGGGGHRLLHNPHH